MKSFGEKTIIKNCKKKNILTSVDNDVTGPTFTTRFIGSIKRKKQILLRSWFTTFPPLQKNKITQFWTFRAAPWVTRATNGDNKHLIASIKVRKNYFDAQLTIESS